LLIVVGLVGLLLPVLPGLPLLLAGLAVIGAEHPLRIRMVRYLRRWRILASLPEDSSTRPQNGHR
jgi:uncharacterized protein YqgC (DUF456 family)